MSGLLESLVGGREGSEKQSGKVRGRTAVQQRQEPPRASHEVPEPEWPFRAALISGTDKAWHPHITQSGRGQPPGTVWPRQRDSLQPGAIPGEELSY